MTGVPTAGRALTWSLANTIAGRLGTVVIGILLARLLGPEEFGTYAVAFVALIAILSFNELGVSLAIVRWRDEPAGIAPTVNTISGVSSAILTAVAWLAAPAFTAAMGDPDATGVVRLLSLCVLVNGLVATPAALLQRGFRQDQRLVIFEVAVEFHDLWPVALGMGDVAGVGHLHEIAAVQAEGDFQVVVVVGRVEQREIELDHQLMQARVANPLLGDAPGAVHPAAQGTDAAAGEPVVFGEGLVAVRAIGV